MNANASRSLADTGFEKNPGLASYEAWLGINRPMLSAMTELHGHLFEQMSKANNEWMGFMSRRLSEDMAASRRFMECKTLQDVFSAYTEFVQRAQQQYQAEFQYFARLNQKLASDTASVIETHIEEAAESAEIRH